MNFAIRVYNKEIEHKPEPKPDVETYQQWEERNYPKLVGNVRAEQGQTEEPPVICNSVFCNDTMRVERVSFDVYCSVRDLCWDRDKKIQAIKLFRELSGKWVKYVNLTGEESWRVGLAESKDYVERVYAYLDSCTP